MDIIRASFTETNMMVWFHFSSFRLTLIINNINIYKIQPCCCHNHSFVVKLLQHFTKLYLDHFIFLHRQSLQAVKVVKI